MLHRIWIYENTPAGRSLVKKLCAPNRSGDMISVTSDEWIAWQRGIDHIDNEVSVQDIELSIRRNFADRIKAALTKTLRSFALQPHVEGEILESADFAIRPQPKTATSGGSGDKSKAEQD